jgi:hypothetical protein
VAGVQRQAAAEEDLLQQRCDVERHRCEETRAVAGRMAELRRQIAAIAERRAALQGHFDARRSDLDSEFHNKAEEAEREATGAFRAREQALRENYAA